ncbi:hypothetical protein [Arthrobacter sp. ZGTC412]|uniref:hypothetical protein n=1 Tax=Arthrobacter sp. ZGTC412 TaxID=2058900 RepID=UPI0011B02C9E|nr:hypothetical protein [Arthrobacter sp. ZGTC412]
MKPITLLDIDGVINPVLRSRPDTVRPDLLLSCEEKPPVRPLAGCGRIGRVSIWPAEATADLEDQLLSSYSTRLRCAAHGPSDIEDFIPEAYRRTAERSPAKDSVRPLTPNIK